MWAGRNRNGNAAVDTRDITVSVIVPTFNRAHYLTIAIDSLLAQQRPPEEIIVIDDQSTDQTGEVLAHYGDRIRVIRNERNIGKPAGLSRAIPLAHGSHIWIFDDDDVALPGALRAHIDYLQSHPDIDFSYSDKFVYEGDGDIWNRDAWRIDPLPVFPPEEFLVRTMESMNTLMQGMLIPAHCYRTVGLFDPAIERCEDHDMLLRLGQRFRAGNLGQPTFVYREHAGVRGSVSDRHAGDERFAVLFRYRQEVFRRARARLSLRHYLPGYDGPDDLAGTNLARALMQRGCIMFRQGLPDEGLDDFREAMRHLPASASPEPWLPVLLSKSIDVEPWAFYDRWRLLRHIHLALRGHRHLARYVARGLYWNLDRAARKRDLSQALGSLQMLATYGIWQCAGRFSPGPTPVA